MTQGGVHVSIRPATDADAPAVRALLRAARLPVDGIPDDLAHFIVAEQDGVIVGSIGLEFHGDAALLRSAAVADAARGTGIGRRLVLALLAYAASRPVSTIVLLTTTAASWFPRFGFHEIPRSEVPEALHASAEFRGACPASATVMRRAM